MIARLVQAAVATLALAACEVPEREFVPDEVFVDAGGPDVPCIGPECQRCESCLVRCVCLGGATETCLAACRGGASARGPGAAAAPGAAD